MTQILYQSHLEGQLKAFRLAGMVSALSHRLKQAEAKNLSYTEFLGLLLEDEANARADNRRKRLYKAAKLPFEKGLEDFEFAFQPSINKREDTVGEPISTFPIRRFYIEFSKLL